VQGEIDHGLSQQLRRPAGGPSGGLAQTVATSKASSLPVSLRSAPARGSSLSARSLSETETNRFMNQKLGGTWRAGDHSFTEKQGQYLAFIYDYSRIFRRPPAEADMQRHFRISPPSVHQMVLTLERAGLIRRQPGVARSIELLVAPEDLPILLTSQNLCGKVRPPHMAVPS